MTDNPPPAPDWVLGDDGHWKPPPFDTGGQRPVTLAPTQAPPPSFDATSHHGGPGTGPQGAPWAGQPAPMPRPPSKGNGAALAIVLGVVGLVVAVPLVLILAVTLLGRSAEPSFQSVGTSVGPGDRDGVLIPIEPGPTTEPSVAPGLAEWCPAAEDVAAATGHPLVPASPEPTTTLDMNGVVADVDNCYYGATIGLGRIVTDDPEGLLDAFQTSRGRFMAGDGGLDVPSARLVLPGGENGAVRVVFVHGDELLTTAVNGPDDGRAEALADILLARPAG